MLRHVVIPKFLLDVDQLCGKVWWRRATLTLAFTSAGRNYDLPRDFDWLEDLRLVVGGTLRGTGLKYIGEDALRIEAAEASTDPGEPAAYYFVEGTQVETQPEPKRQAIRLDVTPDTTYTAHGVYYKKVPFADDSTVLDLDPYVPRQYQGALIEALRAEIFLDRYGIGDERYAIQQAKYENWITRLSGKKEAAARSHVRSVN